LKVLIVRLSSIGDVVHTLPALAALARQAHACAWLVEPAARPLLEGHPLLEAVTSAPPARSFSLSAARRALSELRRSQHDAALDFQGLWKSAAWARLSGARRVIGFAAERREPASRLLLNERAPRPSDAVHVIDRNLALLGALGVAAPGLREFPLPDTGAERERVGRGLAELQASRFALLNPGGGWAGKLWPPEAYGALARELAGRGLPSLVSFGPAE
jgi:lipopolysaccharide heptosyltransferase I